MSDVRHAILQVVSGPEAFRKLVLAPGDTVRVGRAGHEGLADLVLADPGIGKLQFEIDWDGGYVEVRTRIGAIGHTLLDGKPVLQARVKHGAWLHAGSTDFIVYYEAHTPPRTPPKEDLVTMGGDPPNPPARPAHRAHVAAALARLAPLALGETLYGVFDAARDERVLVLLREAVEEHRSLYEGAKGLALAEVAPYLVRFAPGSRLLRALVEEGWGESWGVYFTSGRGPKAARRHLRRFLMVEEGTTGKRLYFRFYDPRVWRDFLALATARQKSEMFEEIDEILLEGPDLAVIREIPDRVPEASEAHVPGA